MGKIIALIIGVVGVFLIGAGASGFSAGAEGSSYGPLLALGVVLVVIFGVLMDAELNE
jgi:hypothetical protein